MSGSRAQAAIVLLFTFAAGTAAGIAVDRLNLFSTAAQADERSEQVSASRGQSGNRFERQTTIERFADDLALTGTQHGEIEGILEHYRTAARSMWSEMRPQYRILMDSIRVRIEDVLDEQQVAQYRALLEERYGRNGDQRESDPEEDHEEDR